MPNGFDGAFFQELTLSRCKQNKETKMGCWFFLFFFLGGGRGGEGGLWGDSEHSAPAPPCPVVPPFSSSTHTSDPPDGHAWLPPDITAEAPIAGTGAAPGARDRERAGRAGGGEGGEKM